MSTSNLIAVIATFLLTWFLALILLNPQPQQPTLEQIEGRVNAVCELMSSVELTVRSTGDYSFTCMYRFQGLPR